MAASSLGKRVKLDEDLSTVELRARLPHMSQSALASLLGIATTEQLPVVTTRAGLRSGRRAYARSATPYGSVLQHIDPGNGPIAVQHPIAMLHKVCSSSATSSSLVKWAARNAGTTKFTIVLYCDEVSPGNQLAYKNARKKAR